MRIDHSRLDNEGRPIPPAIEIPRQGRVSIEDDEYIDIRRSRRFTANPRAERDDARHLVSEQRARAVNDQRANRRGVGRRGRRRQAPDAPLIE
jgi:hypothetical protein